MRLNRMLAGAFGVAALALGVPGLAQPADPAGQASAPFLGRGVNILGYDPIWKDPSRARFKPADYARIRAGGFQTVRVNLQAFSHMDAQGRLEAQWLRTLDGVVQGARAAGLNVILDEHDFNLCSTDLAACRSQLLSFWGQIAPRYQDQPNSVLFEVLNEPHDQLTPAAWNALFREALALIRRTNPTRTVVVGPSHWNSVDDLPLLDLPADDPNLLVTVHYYSPMYFTHQGASWSESTRNVSGVSWGTPGDYEMLHNAFEWTRNWGLAHHRPIFVGEFGAYDKAPLDSRVRYDAGVARAAEKAGFSWAYWQFDSNFTVFDVDRDDWVQPIWHALIPSGDR
jgi:endoglucanase